MDDLDQVLDRQAGVISRSQALAAGLRPHDIRRRVRRRLWAPIHEGVYVDHTGSPTWTQRAWAAVLFAWPAALCHQSALRAIEGPGRLHHGDSHPIHVAIDRNRTVRSPEGVTVHRLAHLDRKALWNTSPPRLRIEEAALDVAAESESDFGAVAVLADAVQSRRTTASRLLRALTTRTRIKRRKFLAAVMTDLHEGVCSALEHAYLNCVERAHGLPTADRQVAASTRGARYRDVVYQAFGLVVERDGRLFHTHPRARDRDLDRDLDAAVDGLATVRLGWGQAVDRPCATAKKIGRIRTSLGWRGPLRTCPRCG